MARDPISQVAVFSTGTVSIRPEHVGPTKKNTYVWLATSRRWTAPRPINVYVIEHERGLVLFDTGQDPASLTDPSYFPGGLTGMAYKRLARFDVPEREGVASGLTSIGYDVGDVRTAIISHLHQDHIGGLPALRHADVLVSDEEWRSLHWPLPELRGLLRRHITLNGLNWSLLRHEKLGDPTLAPFTTGHDLFEDGSLVLLPTPGHTPGSMSLLIRRPGLDPLLLVGDVTYDDSLLLAGEIPGVGHRGQLHRTTAMINALRRAHPGLTVLAAHDPAAADRLAVALKVPDARR